MKVYLGVDDETKCGGGWTFYHNLYKALKDKIEFVFNVEECDVFLIPGASMISRETVDKVKELEKRIILRIDNCLLDSRNKSLRRGREYPGASMSVVREYALMADKVIYQSQWAREYLRDTLRKDGVVIHNGCDQSIFNTGSSKLEKNGKTIYLYSRSSRNDNKGWHEAFYKFQCIHKENPNAELWIMGKFSGENVQYNFDFYNGEKIKFWGEITDRMFMAKIMRTADYFIYSYFNEACSNTLIEAKASGCKILMTESGKTGGFDEIYIKPIEDLTIEKMGENYLKVIKEVCHEYN